MDCKCGMNHDMTFCVANFCEKSYRCMRHQTNHVLENTNSFANFDNFEDCEYFISKNYFGRGSCIFNKYMV